LTIQSNRVGAENDVVKIKARREREKEKKVVKSWLFFCIAGYGGMSNHKNELALFF
jgi:hypothetical protein